MLQLILSFYCSIVGSLFKTKSMDFRKSFTDIGTLFPGLELSICQ
jgi:hypothetical protein